MPVWSRLRRHAAVSLLAIGLVLPVAAHAGPKALFDNTHAETAGNADWEIDTDQPTPVPDQSTVTEATDRTIWLGAISSWGIDLVKRGYTVATLTSTYGITYGNGSNPYDLSNYDVFIVPEPNTRFSSAESLAIFSFVQNGGGLIAVSDHYGSDRNNDGIDSPRIWDQLDSHHFFGASFDTSDANDNISQDSGNYETSLTDSITNGPNGRADSLAYHNGTVMTLYPAVNPTVKGDIWTNGTAHGTTLVMAAHAVYGNGRIVWAGDSSPIDDGSAAPGNSSIFDGWGEVSGRDSLLFQNATMWATRRTSGGDTQPPSVTVSAPNGGESWVAGTSHAITWTASDNVGVTSIDIAYSTDGGATYPNAIATGIANSGSYSWTVPASATTTARVRVTAHDAASNSGNDASNANFTIAAGWTIVASAGAHGSIAPSGNVTVANGGNQTFAITPASGYAVATVTVDGAAQTPAPAYTFTNVVTNHTIAATFVDSAPPTVTVTAPNGGESWVVGTSHAITWTASDNVGVTSVDLAWSTDGGATYPNAIATGVANSGSFTWSPGVATTTARVRVTAHDAAGNSGSDASDANFATPAGWTITASAGAHGSIAPSGAVTVANGGSQSFTITPDAGFGVASLLVDGIGQPAATSYTFTNVVANHTIVASFADTDPPSVTVTSPNGGEDWKAGSTHAITWTASDNVGVTTIDIAWTGNGTNTIAAGIANSGSYSWTVPMSPTSGATVQVTAHDAAGHSTTDSSDAPFTIDAWSILASAGAHGSIAPSGVVAVSEGASQSFTITPNAGFIVSALSVDGAAAPPATSYTFTAVAANHTIAASFADGAAPQVTLSSPVGGEDWKAGSSHSILWTASDNVGVTSVDIAYSTDGGATYPNAIVTGFPNDGAAPWTIPTDLATTTARVRITAHDGAGNSASDASAANFTIDDWSIATAAGAHGTITPPGPVSVAEGGSQTFTITPDTDYQLGTLTVDGAAVAPATSYTFDAVAANHTIAATFTAVDTPSVAVTAPSGGERWRGGEVHEIDWNASDLAGITGIDLAVSFHGEAGPWLPIASGIDNTGNYDWTVPDAQTDSAYVAVTAHAGTRHATARDGGLFSIYPATNAVPAGGHAVFALARPAPNPSHAGVALRFSLPRAGAARLAILDLAGRSVRELVRGDLAAGDHAASWDGRDGAGARVAPGIYLVRLESGGAARITRIVRL